MNRKLADFVKESFASIGYSIAKRHKGEPNGYYLHHDLNTLFNRPNLVCFDIGANEGQTITMFQANMPDPSVFSFEPSSSTFNALAKRSFGPKVKIYPFALGERVGEAKFLNYRQSVLSSLLPMNHDKKENIFAGEELVSTEIVRVDTIDNFCTVNNIPHIDLLKIDTQGFEWPVLLGSATMFAKKKIDAVLLELNFTTLYEGQSDPLEILSFLRSNSFKLIDFYEKERKTGREISWTTALFVRVD